MTKQKLLGLLFEHIDSNEVFEFTVNWDTVIIEFIATDERYSPEKSIIYLNENILTQYNNIFGYDTTSTH